MAEATPAGSTATAPRSSLIANCVPIGVGGFALTTFTLGLYTTGHFDAKGEVLVVALSLFFGGLVQLIAGFFALARGDVFPAAFMSAYGAFWISYAALVLYVIPHAGAAANQAVTVYLVGWTITTFIFLLATLFTNWVVFAVFVEFVATLIVADIGSWAANTGLTHAAGYLEIILGVLGWYIVASEMINVMAKREILPFPPMPLSPDHPKWAGRVGA